MGHKIFSRYVVCGLEGLTDRSRRPYRQANRLSFQIESLIVQLKHEHPSRGAPKIRAKIRRKRAYLSLPAISTVHAVLDRHGLVSRARQRHHYRAEARASPSPISLTIYGVPPRPRGEYIFSGTGGELPLAGGTKAQARMMKAFCAVSGDRVLVHWSPHDLRRTVVTRIAEQLGTGSEQMSIAARRRSAAWFAVRG